MRYHVETMEELSRYLYMKYINKKYDPLDVELEYIKIIINNTIDDVVNTLYKLDKYNLAEINELKTYKFRILPSQTRSEFGFLNQFIQDHLIDLNEIYESCYQILAIPLIEELEKNNNEEDEKLQLAN